MRVAVITPYYNESIFTLNQCIKSVEKQTYKDIHHFVVADGNPFDDMDDYTANFTHISLPPCRDFGDTPRGVATAVAWAQGFDAIAYLDADCWYHKDHIRTMVGVMKESGRDIITCPRKLYTSSGKFLAECIESDGWTFNDTNCFLFKRNVFGILSTWMFKDLNMCAVDDKVLWQAIQQFGIQTARSLRPTVNYTTTLAFHYQQHGKKIPKHAKVIADIGDGLKTYNYWELHELQSAAVLQVL